MRFQTKSIYVDKGVGLRASYFCHSTTMPESLHYNYFLYFSAIGNRSVPMNLAFVRSTPGGDHVDFGLSSAVEQGASEVAAALPRRI